MWKTRLKTTPNHRSSDYDRAVGKMYNRRLLLEHTEKITECAFKNEQYRPSWDNTRIDLAIH